MSSYCPRFPPKSVHDHSPSASRGVRGERPRQRGAELRWFTRLTQHAESLLATAAPVKKNPRNLASPTLSLLFILDNQRLCGANSV